ncbi:uncharacterized protein LOC127873573 [Dreissena polymorpha]|uniref:uncharacterized protein LOC127873573 n=1 Tax=Dreissena polymorpha TaxID=45954 RepID=UPI0022643F71|nr:uncharacterized protein LOC127873573 [Dreissena polymorpha]
MSACHFSDSDCIGQQRVDDTFNPNSLEAQIALRDFCNKLHDFSHEDIERFKIRRDFSTGEPEIKCFARDLDLFLAAESTVSGANLTLPWTYRKSMKFMESHSLTYNTLKFNTSFPDVLEIPIAYWLNDRYLFKNKSSFNKFHDLIGERIGPYSSPLKTDFSEFYGNRLVYFGVQVNLTLGRFSSGYVEGKPVMDRWESFVQKEMAAMPPGLQNGFQLTKDYWHSLAVQKSLKDSAIFGIVLGIILALPILTIATENFIVGFVATFCMCCSTVCVVGIIPLIGWKLGVRTLEKVLEALNMCMVVGLTVDYVVHLAEGYHLSKRLDRKSRVQDMLEVMGLSVFSGACTTLGACVFMFFAQIQFMVRFGIFMFSTIGFSLIFSLGLFPTLMGMIGPDGDTGNIKAIYRKLIRRCS